MEQKRNACLELILGEEQQDYERIANEAVYREVRKNFPKTCSCGKVYQSETDFIRKTEPCGLVLSYGQEMPLYATRNCTCQSTLGMDLNSQQLTKAEYAAIIKTAQTLGERCLNDIQTKMISGLTFQDTSYGEILAAYLKKADIERIGVALLSSKVNLEDQTNIGMTIFLERYQAWSESKA